MIWKLFRFLMQEPSSTMATNTDDYHHHLLIKSPFLPGSARVRRFPRYEASPHIPEHCPIRVQTKLNRVLFYTFSPSLPVPAHTSHPRHHHHISTGRHPIISTLMFHMPKPSKSITPQPRSEHPKDCTNPHWASLSFRDTPHIYLTIIRSALSRLCRFSAFIAHVSVPYVNTLWT